MSIRKPHLVLSITLLVSSTLTFANQSPMQELISIPRTDVVNAGVGGIGAPSASGGGVGTIELAGVSGTVTLALLYWHGIDINWPQNSFVGGNADYDEIDIVFDGAPLAGTRVAHYGDNNGWPSSGLFGEPPPDSAASYRADVTDRVQLRGNGTYVISGLSDGAGHSTNGASLIVYFDDGIASNDFKVAHYEGLQSNNDGEWVFPFEVDYQGGPVDLVLHVADGQTSLNDGEFRFEVSPGVPGETGNAKLYFSGSHYADGLALFGGLSVPGMGFGRAGDGLRLWDIRRFPLTGAFGPAGEHGVTTHWSSGGEALSLLVAQVMQPADPHDPILTPNPFDFGDVIEDTLGTPHQFVLRNLLPHPIVISGTPTVTTDWFQIVAQTCSGLTLAPNATCTVDVRCAPMGFAFAGPQSLRVAWTKAGYTRAVTSYASLLCHGVPATTFSRLEVTPYSHDFGNVIIGEAGAPHRFVARNTGQLPVTVTSLEFRVSSSGGSVSQRFRAAENGCAARTLQPGEECPFDLVFHPLPNQAPSTFKHYLFLGYSASDDASDHAKATLIGHAILDPNAIFRDGFGQ